MAGDNTTLARPYAQAVFESAKQSDTLVAWSEALAFLAVTVADQRVRALVVNPNFGQQRLVELMLGIGEGQLDDRAQNLVRLLVENRRLLVLPEIAAMFERLKRESERTIDALVTTALPLDTAQEKVLAEQLKKALGCEIHITSEQDASLIGGVHIRAGDLVIDGSVRGRLRKLETELAI